MRMLAPFADTPDMTVPALKSLMRAAYETGDAEQAVAIADRLLADEYESIEIYEIASLAAERLGRTDAALRYGKLAFRLDKSHHQFATRILDHHLERGETEQFASWHAEVLDRLSGEPDVLLARALTEWAVVHRDEAMFRTAAMVVARAETRSAGRLVEEAVAQGMSTVAAEVIVDIIALPTVDGVLLRNFRAVAEQWSARSDELLEQGRIGDAFALASACVAVLPKNGDARRVERNVVLFLRNEIRAAQARGDHDAVIAMGASAGRMLYRRHEIAVAYARSLLAVGRGQEALAVAQLGREAFPENIDLQGVTAHIAASIGEMALALQLYGALRDAAEPGALRYRERAERFFERSSRTGIKLVRALVATGDYEQAIELCRLLEIHTEARERISVEFVKLRRILRTRLRELEEEEESGMEAMRILGLMLDINPGDPSTLRRAALEAMKLQDFDAAVGYWRELDRVSPGLENTANNINRCQIYAQRQAARANRARTALAA